MTSLPEHIAVHPAAGFVAPESTHNDHQAHAAGYAAGWSAGSREAKAAAAEAAERLRNELTATANAQRAELASAIAALRTAAEVVAQRSSSDAEQLAEVILDSAVQLATALLGHELSAAAAGRAALDRVVRECPAPPAQVYLHPADIEQLRAGDIPAGVRVCADPALDRGDARADHEHGQVELRLADMLTAMCAALGTR
ncbi:MAG: hypothetical protein CSA58_05330 [Micrococcales bacterium]|nr:MAG: hypothetical protein CSB46_04490 [Micrococcales bacterium]PIE27207.1 MAG: hypothetical protein CSA58_05330 [Micrococcales bacterium]